MLRTDAAEIARLTGGALIGGASGAETVTGSARIDSRAVEAGDLFAAFDGEHVDGHRFVGAAREAGAALCLVSREVDVPAVLVDDVEAALSALAAAQLAAARTLHPQLQVIAVTGSAGKTGTKDLIGQLLAPLGPTVAPPGSPNNELGLPLTVLSLDESTRFLVLEMGARGIGHIAHLTAIAPPDISLVLNVGTAHLGEFGSVEAIAQAKGEIIEALGSEGRAVLAAEDSRVAQMASRSAAPVLTWGLEQGDLQAHDIDLDELARPTFTLVLTREVTRADGTVIAAGSAPVALRTTGEHQVHTALASAGAALLAGADLSAVATGLSTAEAVSAQRMEMRRAGDVLVVNDAYNANPDSMRLALRTLAHLGRGRRTFAVLGEMLELGEDAVRLHDEIGRLAVRLNVTRLIVVGPGAAPIHQGACLEGSFGGESTYVGTLDEALAVLEREVRGGDVVLLKSSRDSGLRTLAPRILAHLQAEPSGHAPQALGTTPGQGDTPA
ncbi:UDP-N-acetylmuramoyl-tripeptide--D-alanyl-D-alanine ligase [Brachybacterium hainanense]|uniref:UDP-N-acetylmuramoyl-tripeptide--D-alanyl-D-alanine ligase n=1 Tax=Brachybacterium hainanense TaxID=1541174 RepID=A0ABV6REQ2_9MICO